MENVIKFISENKLQGNAYRTLATIIYYQVTHNYQPCPNKLLLQKLKLNKTALSKCIVDIRKLGLITDTEKGKKKFYSINWAITTKPTNPGTHPDQRFLAL